MAGKQSPEPVMTKVADRLIDFSVTMICWTYFTIGFVVLYSHRYIIAYLFSPQRELAFQRLTSLFYQRFFQLVRIIVPCHKWEIDRQIQEISSSVIICNHLSYLDPILLISLLKRQKTIVKTIFFKVPVFGWLIRNAGYFPADGKGKYGLMMIDQVEQMEDYLKDGGNLFVFPEGTRSRDGKIGSLNRGALKIARLCRAPVYIFHLTGTEKLFTPGKFLFNTRVSNTITLKIIERIAPLAEETRSLAELEERIRQAYLLQTGSQCSTP